MSELTGCSKCGMPNEVFYHFCPQCGNRLLPPPAWAMVGRQPERTSAYQPDQRQLWPSTQHSHPLEPAPGIAKMPGSGPQPILAHNVLWYWAKDGTLHALRLGMGQLGQENGLEPQKELSANGPGMAEPKFCQSPVFDGVFVNYLVDDAFCRVNAFRGSTVSIPTLPDSSLVPEPAAAPLLVQCPRPGKPHQRICLFVAAAMDGVMVADISRRGEERYAFYRWPGAEENDRLRSPVLVGDRVLLVSEWGEVLALPLINEMVEDFRDGELARLGRVKGVRCFAPTAVRGRLVCQTVPARPGSTKEMQLGAFCWKPQSSDPPVRLELDMQTSESNFQRQGRWSCPTWNGNALLLNDMFDRHLVIWPPGGGPSKIDLSERANPTDRRKASLQNNQSIVYGDQLLSFDRYNRVMVSWHLPNCHAEGGVRLPFPPSRSGESEKQALLCPPIASSRLLILIFKDHVAMTTVDHT